MLAPRITANGHPVPLSQHVVVPSEFVATFDEDPQVTLFVEVDAGTPRVRAMGIKAIEGFIDREVRVPIHSRYLPAAVAAASMSVLAGETRPQGVKLKSVSLPNGQKEEGMIGPINLYARVASHKAMYDEVSGRRRRGRPRLVTSDEELLQIVKAYHECDRSVSKAKLKLPDSEATIRRRLAEAVKRGLMPEQDLP